jgi:hypothetical protein
MGSIFDGINDKLRAFIEDQPLFFVATAPMAAEGHINLSPKGMGSLKVLDRSTVAYLDLTGSGIETISHLKENGRIVVMLCAFEGPPRIVRLHGRGDALMADTDGFDKLAHHFPTTEGRRAIITVRVDRVADSCGFGVPLMDYAGERPQMPEWVERKGGREGILAYQEEKNRASIDGLPGINPGASADTP